MKSILKYKLFFLSCLIFSMKLVSQDYIRICDSILKLPIHDSEKVNILKLKAKATFETDVNSNIYYMEKALPLAEKLKKYDPIHFLYNNLGNSYLDKGDFGKAIEFNIKCLKQAEKENDKEDIVNSLMNLGNTYTDKEEDVLGKDCYMRAVAIIKEMKQPLLLADVYSNIALLFDNVTEKDSVLYYTSRALKIYEDTDNKDGIGLSNNNLGLLYMDNGENKKAFEHFFKAKNIYKITHNDQSMFLTMNNIGDLYLRTGDYKRSFAEYDSALSAFHDLGSIVHLLDVYEGLANASVKLNNFEKAHEFRKKYSDLKDSAYSIENLNKFSEIKTGYDKEVSEKEIKLLKAENELKETRKKTYQVLAIIALIFIIGVSWVFYYRSKIKQRSAIALQRKNKEIEEKNKNITDSITYAQRIQQAILPSEQDFSDCFKDHFIFFKPKDIVSGDFYWLLPIMEDGRKKVILATSDCTGHGVPGGFMSMLGSSLLTEIVNEKKVTEPADILDLLRIKIISALKQKGTSGENQDGMDISICKFDPGKKLLVHGAANNSIYHVRETKLIELKPDKQPIGISHTTSQQFNQHEIALQDNDCIYTFTDGFADQFGGAKGKKFKYRQLEELLLNNSSLSMVDQKNKLEETFENWKSGLEQVDDILIIGVRI